MASTLTARDRMRIAIEAGSALRTIDRIYAGERSHATTFERVVRAAQKLGFEPPSPPLAADPELQAEARSL